MTTWNISGYGGVTGGSTAVVAEYKQTLNPPCACCATNFFPYGWANEEITGTPELNESAIPLGPNIIVPQTMSFNIPGIEQNLGSFQCQLFQDTITAYPQSVTIGNTLLVPGRLGYGATYVFQNPVPGVGGAGSVGFMGTIQISGTLLPNNEGTLWIAAVSCPLGGANIAYRTFNWQWNVDSNVFPDLIGESSNNCKNYPTSITVTSNGSIDCACLATGNWCGSFRMMVQNDIYDSDTGIKLLAANSDDYLNFQVGCQCSWDNGYCVWYGFPGGLISGGTAKVLQSEAFPVIMLSSNGDGATLQLGLAGPIIDGYQYIDGYGAPTYGGPHPYNDGSDQYTGNWTCTFQESLSFEIEDFDCSCRYMIVPGSGITLYPTRND